SGQPAAAGRLCHGDGTRHQPRLDVLHDLPAPSPPGQPGAGEPAADPDPARHPLLRRGKPRLHGGLRAVTSPVPAAVADPRAPARPPSTGRWLRAALRATRPRQWPKNLLVLAAPLAGASLGRRDGLGYALVAVAAFGAASAAVYLVNDTVDAERDRRHPVKRNRPIAS